MYDVTENEERRVESSTKHFYGGNCLDSVSYHTVLYYRAKRYARITGDSPPKKLLRQLCDKHFLNLLNSDLYHRYMVCIMNGRLLGINISFDIEVNNVDNSDEKAISLEWVHIMSQIDEVKLEKLISRIRKRIARL